MRGYMFRNRWGALLFVGLTLAGVTTLVGSEKGDGAIQQATSQIAQQKAQAEQFASNSGPQTDTVQTTDTADIPFADDEELIDSGIGDDPTPIDDFAPDGAPEADGPSDEVTIVSRDDPAEPDQPTPSQ